MPHRERVITTENELVNMIIKFLNMTGYKVFIEVPNMGQSTDIVAKKNRWLTFIEAKIHDWKRGLKQCQAHEKVADFICIALATKKVPSGLIIEARKKGYGIIHCDSKTGSCIWYQRPISNKKIWKPQRQILLKSLRAIDYEH